MTVASEAVVSVAKPESQSRELAKDLARGLQSLGG